MVISTIKFESARELETFLDEEMQRTGWIEMIGADDRTRADCIENAGIKKVDWVNNTVWFSTYAPEYDY